MESNDHPSQTLLYFVFGVITWLFSEQGVLFLDVILKIVSIASFAAVIFVNIPRIKKTFKELTGQ
jgi:hypothetical protein